jgi:hypothetical protein
MDLFFFICTSDSRSILNFSIEYICICFAFSFLYIFCRPTNKYPNVISPSSCSIWFSPYLLSFVFFSFFKNFLCYELREILSLNLKLIPLDFEGTNFIIFDHRIHASWHPFFKEAALSFNLKAQNNNQEGQIIWFPFIDFS